MQDKKEEVRESVNPTNIQHKRRSIGPVNFKVASRKEAVQEIVHALHAKRPRVFAFCNMHTFNIATQSAPFAGALSRSTVFNDGVGIDIASRILFGFAFKENLNGTDLTPELLKGLQRPVRTYIVGSAPGVAEETANRLTELFPSVHIVGVHHGFFSDQDSEQIVKNIRTAETELVLVGMGNPRQEIWADRVSCATGAVLVCVGAYLDFAAGRFTRAPKWIRTARLEWLYRMCLEPERLWKRYLVGAPRFLIYVLSLRRASIRSPF